MSLTVSTLFQKFFTERKEKAAKILTEVYEPKLRKIREAVETNSDIKVLHEKLFELVVLKDILEATTGIHDTLLLTQVDQLYNTIEVKINGIREAQKGGKKRRVKK